MRRLIESRIKHSGLWKTTQHRSICGKRPTSYHGNLKLNNDSKGRHIAYCYLFNVSVLWSEFQYSSLLENIYRKITRRWFTVYMPHLRLLSRTYWYMHLFRSYEYLYWLLIMWTSLKQGSSKILCNHGVQRHRIISVNILHQRNPAQVLQAINGYRLNTVSILVQRPRRCPSIEAALEQHI